MVDRYGRDVLSHDPHREGPFARMRRSRPVVARTGMVLEDVASGFVGAVIRIERDGEPAMVLEDRRGRTRTFRFGGGFWLDGEPVLVGPPAPEAPIPAGPRSPGGRSLTNSGSIAAPALRPRVARGSRLWVEGRHDADLVEHVWGEDLAGCGVAVELLEGVDNLADVMRDFAPTPSRRAGVLVDHLVGGSKESRIAARVGAEHPGGVLIVGHPFVDVWQAVKPGRLGLPAWPVIPRGTDIKAGTLAALGWPHATRADVALGWRRILARVRDFRDVEPELLGRVEQLIDFVTAPGTR